MVKKKSETANLEKSLWKVKGNPCEKSKGNPCEKSKGNLCNRKQYKEINRARWAAVSLKMRRSKFRLMMSDFDLFVWMLMVLLIDADDGLSKGRGHNFQHLGRGTGQVRQVELQVLGQN